MRWRFEKDENRATLWIRPWDGIRSMPEGLAVLRAIERKYGKLKHFMFLRDPQCRDMYQPFFYAELESMVDLEQIPEGRQAIQLEVPIFERPPPGGIGLEHIDGLLTPEEKVDDYATTPSLVERVAEQVSTEGTAADAPPPTTRVIDVQIERSSRKQSLRSGPNFSLSEERQLQVSKSIVQWGGFYSPPAPPQPLSEEDILLGAKLPSSKPLPEPSRRHMELYLKKWQPRVQHLLSKPKLEAEEGVEEDRTVATAADVPRTIAVEHLLQQDMHEEPPVEAEAEAAEVELPLEPEPEQHRSSKRRERLLALARQNARTPLPDSVRILTTEEEAQRRAELAQQKEEEKRAKESVRDRLWKLIGGGGGSWL